MPKILVVDDSPTIRIRCNRILISQGFEVFEAVDGEDALEKVKAVYPDVILLDLIMPKLNGHEVLAFLKKNEVFANIPVIMFTVKKAGEDIVDGLNKGADEYIGKPFSAQELTARVNAMWRIKSYYDKLSEQSASITRLYQELFEAQQKISEQEKVALVGQLMVGIHHELRNPLAAALSDAQILLSFFQSVGEQQYFVADIEEQLQRIKNILDNIKVRDSIELDDYIDDIKMVKLL